MATSGGEGEGGRGSCGASAAREPIGDRQAGVLVGERRARTTASIAASDQSAVAMRGRSDGCVAWIRPGSIRAAIGSMLCDRPAAAGRRRGGGSERRGRHGRGLRQVPRHRPQCESQPPPPCVTIPTPTKAATNRAIFYGTAVLALRQGKLVEVALVLRLHLDPRRGEETHDAGIEGDDHEQVGDASRIQVFRQRGETIR